MLSALLGWIPILGPIVQGITSIATSFFGTETAKVNAEVEEAKVSAQIIRDTSNDIALRFMRDIYCFPACVHLLFSSWDTMIAETTWISHKWMWHVASYPKSYAWYPTTVAIFLLGNIGFNTWKRLK